MALNSMQNGSSRGGKIERNLLIIYLFTLPMVVGASLYVTILNYVMVFDIQKWLGKALDRYQESFIMTQNFTEMKYFIIITVIIIALYEGYQYKKFNRDLVKTISALGAIMSGSLFSFFYLESLIEMVNSNSVGDVTFENMAKGAFFALILFMIFNLILFFKTLLKELK
jgi:hypothetical protein